jgi:hypothetical protein
MTAFNIAKEKKVLLENLKHLKSLPVQEYTFTKKYEELKYKVKTNRRDIHHALDCVWSAKDFKNDELTVEQIENLKPKIIIADDNELVEWWGIYRLFLSSAEYNQTRGRYIRFFVVDANEVDAPTFLGRPWPFAVNKLGWPVLGIGAVSSDLPALGDRDTLIGWTREQKVGEKKWNHIAIGSTIVPTQPFGFNLLGGKLIAALMTSEIIRNEWQLRYGDVLVGMTTTSLYGTSSMYDKLPWWNAIGKSKGLVTIQPSPEIYRKWLKHIKKDFEALMEKQQEEKGYTTQYKPTILKMVFKAAGINEKDFLHGFERGMYFSEFYENTKEFLCGKISEDELKLKPLIAGDVGEIMKWWRPQALGRYKMLLKKDRLKIRKHFYNHLGYMDYETAKAVFFNDVGR